MVALMLKGEPPSLAVKLKFHCVPSGLIAPAPEFAGSTIEKVAVEVNLPLKVVWLRTLP
jgi:hypothetical protein